MGQATSVSQDNSHQGQFRLTGKQIDSLFFQSCISVMSSVELSCLKSNLHEDNLSSQVDIHTLNSLFNISESSPGFQIWFRFLKSVSQFPFLRQIESDIEFLKISELIKAMTILSSHKRSKLFDNSVSFDMIILACFAASFGKFESKDDDSVKVEEFNEKTGEIETHYFSDSQVVVWSQLPLIKSLNFFDYTTSTVASTSLLNFITIALTTIAASNSSFFNSVTSKTESSVCEFFNYNLQQSMSSYNDFKIAAFNMVKSTRYSAKSSDLLSKTCLLTIHEVDSLLKSIPNLCNAISNLLVPLIISNEVVAPSTKFNFSKLFSPMAVAQISSFMSSGFDSENTYQNSGSLLPQPQFNLKNCRNLYTGSQHGFSMKSFEHRVTSWRAPSFLLVQGKKPKANAKYSRFANKFPKHLANEATETIVFGAYINVPWHKSAKSLFGDKATTIFQLRPNFNVFRAKTAHNISLSPFGVGIGNPVPSNRDKFICGNVSLTIDQNLEYGAFWHSPEAGGLFSNGEVFEDNIPNYQEFFAITEIEVWGIGSDAVFKAQEASWAWEEKEAERRNRVNVKSLGEDRALLEMAGLVGQNHGGGSM